LALLVGGLVLPAFFGLVDKEMGVRSRGPRGRWGAIAALIGIVALWGVRDYEHRRAVNALEARTYEGENPLRASAYPYWWSPFRWSGVVEAQNFFAVMVVDSLTPEVDPDGQMQVFYKPEETPVTLAAKRSDLGRVYLDWAQYPLTETEQLPDGYLVRFRDLRYAYAESKGRSVLSSSVELDQNLNVIAENVGTRSQRVPAGAAR